MGFLPLEDLGEQILPDRLLQEAVAGARHDRDEPRQHQQQNPEHADQRPQPHQPARRAVRDRERERRQPDDHQDQRTFQQDAGRERGPEDQRVTPAECRARSIAPGTRAPSRPCAATQQSSSIASVLASRASTPSSTRGRHHQAGEIGRAARHEGERRPIGEQHRADRAEQRGNAIEPDGRARLRHADALRRRARRRPAANRCRPASCSGPRPGSGCRCSRRSRSSAWSPARSAPRRGRPAGC